MAAKQQLLLGSGTLGYNAASGGGYCAIDFWDSQEARFKPCFLPVAATIPAVAAGLVLLVQAVSLATPPRYRWFRPFVEEHDARPGQRQQPEHAKASLYSYLLTACSALGFVLQAVLAWHSWPQMTTQLTAGTWFLLTGSTAALRPRTVPTGVLFARVLQTAALGVVLGTEGGGSLPWDRALNITTMVLAVLSIVAILCMPVRDSNLPRKDVSKPFTEPNSALRSPEDGFKLWQWMTVVWMGPLIRIGSKRQLQDEDVWQLPYEFQHSILHEKFRQLNGTVIRRLLKANWIDLAILTLLGLLELVAGYAGPVLLQKLLRAMEDSSAPRRAAMTYAGMTLVVRLIACQSAVFSLWFGRRCYERSRGEMITMLYEKILGRKNAFQHKAEKGGQDASGAGGKKTGAAGVKKFKSMFDVVAAQTARTFKRTKKEPPVKEPAAMGKILNLMRNDVYEVAQRFWEFQALVNKPLSCIFSIVLVVRFLGPTSLLAILVLFICQALNAVLARIMVIYERRRRAATDDKLRKVSQFIEAIRHLRWYGWQDAWLEEILKARQKELDLKIQTSLWNVGIIFVNNFGLDATPVVAFFAYTVIAKQPLRVDIAFPAIQLLQMMNSALRDLPDLIIVIINAMVAVDRIEDFMAEPNRLEMNTEALIGDSLAIHHGFFSWPGVSVNVLEDIDLSFPPGLSVILGEVGSGKTALLQALLGELDMHQGQLIKPNVPVGYCDQSPWLQTMSIRENILFGAPYDEKRYKDVLDACALTPDLASFKSGDLSLIGENGIGLSGGQRARVALARAVYSRTTILLLDDPLAALDQDTARSITQKCFAGSLVSDRTVIMVTHRTELVLPFAEQVIQLENGRARVIDNDAAEQNTLRRLSTTRSENDADKKALEKQKAAAVPDKFIEEEHRAKGGVKLSVYWTFIKKGKLRWWAAAVVTLVLYRLVAIAQQWFLKSWGEAYNDRSAAVLFIGHGDVVAEQLGFFDSLPRPDEDIRPWLICYAVLALASVVVLVINNAIAIVVVYNAARALFGDIMRKIAHANFRFFDVTPVGRLMNRLTSDTAVIDGNISGMLRAFTWNVIAWTSALVVIASVTPAFLAFSVVLVLCYIMIFMRFLPTSQSLRRLEMVSLSPLMSNFGALLNGLTTVRAFCAQDRFQGRVIEVVDTFQKMDHFYWSLQTWLQYRSEILSAVSTFLLTILALVTELSAGLMAFVLLNAQNFVTKTHLLCRQYGALQMEFVSVERVVELLHLEQESEGTVHPPAWWPSYEGDIEFEDVTIKYAPHLDPALRKISFKIKGGSKTAIIGRTGSGKSTLALSLLATILPESGRILVDHVDLAEVDKHLLRTRITFLAQDPILFPGSMRDNLDPIKEHTDDACELVLRRVCERQGWRLDTKIEAGGRNLSQGQRQLVGLARAVIRRSAIIILDEATASIDRDTASQIQQVMQEEMKESTVITIAHRLEAVRNADYCIVLGKGEILEQGPADEMLKRRRAEMVDPIDYEHDASQR